ncbi:MAG: PAS domain-containing sensor histidine kinase [Terriglobia bacterium]|nr:MAG: PAS domain-containing sensor histidine kinase [Terriglobia bacterium]
MIGFWLEAGERRILLIVCILIPCVTLMDWSVGDRVSLGVLYILPMMIGAIILNARGTALVAIVCAFLRAWFDTPASLLEATLRFVFAWLAYFVSGLFVMALVRNRRLVVEHLSRIEREQGLRREAEEQLRVLVESSPAAILTLDHAGVVLGCNNAANDLFLIPDGQTLQGKTISNYLPLLSDAVQLDTTRVGFRTAAQCQGRREDGEIFLAHTWFSSYAGPEGKRLAAIVVDSSEEMREREERNLIQLRESNRVVAAAVSHEIKTLCRALSLMTANLREQPGISGNADFDGLVKLISGLEKIAHSELHLRVKNRFEQVSLKEVLDNLRIVIEPNWREAGGVIRWCFRDSLPTVLADPHGLLQVFLSLAENSYRALQESEKRELMVNVGVDEETVAVRFKDSGPGVAAPDFLFQPFQQGADNTGMGLYIARAALRGYGGDLRFEPQPEGACFVVELQIAGPNKRNGSGQH